MKEAMKEVFVDFSLCESCKHRSKHETEFPCWKCLDHPTREKSEKPVYYEKENK